MVGQMYKCPHCQLETLLLIQTTAEPAPQSTSAKKRNSTIWWIFAGTALAFVVLFLFLTGYLLLQISLKETNVKTSQTSPEQMNLKTVVGALGWNLGDVLPDTFQVTTNDDLYGITYNFNPPAEIGTDPFSECFLILTEDRRIATICVSGPENDHFNALNFQKILKEKYGSGRKNIDRDSSTYYFGQGNRQVILTTIKFKELPLEVVVKYNDEQLYELVKQQIESRKVSLKNQIQNNLKGKF